MDAKAGYADGMPEVQKPVLEQGEEEMNQGERVVKIIFSFMIIGVVLGVSWVTFNNVDELVAPFDALISECETACYNHDLTFLEFEHAKLGTSENCWCWNNETKESTQLW